MTNNFEQDAIRNLQEYLRHLSYHSESINPVPIDGIWGDDTRRALIAFQNENNLEPTGTADRETWELLKERYDLSVAQNSPPAALALFPRVPRDYVIREGEDGLLVYIVRYLLNELSRLYYFPEIALLGNYDGQIANVVKDFQRRNYIEASGNVDRETWDAMAVQHNLLLGYDE